MQVNVKYLENLRIESLFDDFSVISDQPIRYKGDGTAPGPFDYFLASSAMCAAYFVKVYCNARDIPTEDIKLIHNNIVDPENRYKQKFDIQIELPDSISEKDKAGIIASMERCTVKRVIQNEIDFNIQAKSILGSDAGLVYDIDKKDKETLIYGKDASLEQTIQTMTKLIEQLGIKIEIASWRNPIAHVWSVHIRDAHSPMCYTNGKGSTKDSALCSALGEYLERISNNYFYNDYYLGDEISNADFVHYKDEIWSKLTPSGELTNEILDEYTREFYNPTGELKDFHLIDTNSGNSERGVCSIPFTRQSDKEKIYFPVNIIGNLYVSNGMSAGNSKFEARVQALSEIFERAIKNKIIIEEISLPDIPENVLSLYPNIKKGIEQLESKGFPIVLKDASLGGKYPVLCVALLNPKNGGVFASFGAHPNFEVALERSLTELLQGRSFEGMNDILPPSFNSFKVQEHNNIIDHFIDSTGIVSWKLFSSKTDYQFEHWNFSGTTNEEFDHLMGIFNSIDKEVYIADYNDLGVNASRIIVPDFSEIYPVEDLIWDNNNRSLDFRQRILNLFKLNQEELAQLCNDLIESEHDDYMPISELIGVAFDENSTWGQCNIGELKALIYLDLKQFDSAKEYVEMFLTFNDNLPLRKSFYQLIDNILDIELDPELNIKDYKPIFKKMYSQQIYDDAMNTIYADSRFTGLTPTDTNLKDQDKHQRLLDSYKKLIKRRMR